MAALRWTQENPDFDVTERRYLHHGKPIPEELLPPDILPGFDSWYRAFFELSTERQHGYTGAGPIPRSAIMKYSRGWKPGERGLFMAVIRALDNAYLNPRTAEDIEAEAETTNPARDQFRASMRKT